MLQWRRWSSRSRRGAQSPLPGSPCPGPRPPAAPRRAGPGPSRGALVASGGGGADAENISFKSYSRDSGHGGSEQEDSPRSHCAAGMAASAVVGTTAAATGTSQRSNKMGRPLGLEAAVAAAATLDTPGRGGGAGHAHAHTTGQRRRGAARVPSPWNHTYTEIRDGRGGGPPPALALALAHDDDPVYEEIERSDVQVSDMSDEDARRQSDASRQSSRSYGDHRPLIPCLPTHALAHTHTHAHFLYPEARAVAVLDGETVVCHLRPELYARGPCAGRATHYSEC